MIPGIYGVFPTADGWIAIVGVAGPARDLFYRTIGRPDLIERFNHAPLLRGRQGGLVAHPRRGVRDEVDGGMVRAARGRRPALRPGPGPRRGGGGSRRVRPTATSPASRTRRSRDHHGVVRAPVRFSDPSYRGEPGSPNWDSTPRRCCSRPATPGTTSRACRRTVRFRHSFLVPLRGASKETPVRVEVKGLEPSTYGLQSRRSSS